LLETNKIAITDFRSPHHLKCIYAFAERRMTDINLNNSIEVKIYKEIRWKFTSVDSINFEVKEGGRLIYRANGGEINYQDALAILEPTSRRCTVGGYSIKRTLTLKTIP
jgi:hypothetical protein